MGQAGRPAAMLERPMASLSPRRPAAPAKSRSLQGTERLIEVIQELSLARTLCARRFARVRLLLDPDHSFGSD